MNINYKIGDKLVSKDNPSKEIGTCTGFRQDGACVDIDGKCWGGSVFFMKSEWTECTVLSEHSD